MQSHDQELDCTCGLILPCASTTVPHSPLHRRWISSLLAGALLGSGALSGSTWAQVTAYNDEGLWQAVLRDRFEVSFDEATGVVGTRYSGLEFGASTCGTINQVSPHSLDTQSSAGDISSPNVMIAVPNYGNGGGAWYAEFAEPVRAVGFWLADLEFTGSSITFLDQSGSVIEQIDFATVGTFTPVAWQFLGFVSVTRIKRIEVCVPSYEYLEYDNFQYGEPLPPDTTPPVLSCPPFVSLVDRLFTGPGEIVQYSVTVTDNMDPAPVVICVPPSGSLFPRGTTIVTCTATDASGNQSVCTFPVVVTPKLRPR